MTSEKIDEADHDAVIDAVVKLADDSARQWFELAKESLVAEMTPHGSCWDQLNEALPGNLKASRLKPTRVDQLFEFRYAAMISLLWSGYCGEKSEEATERIRRNE